MKQAIVRKKTMGEKMLLFALAILFLASVHLAEAQQATKVLQIGFVSGTGDSNAPVA